MKPYNRMPSGLGVGTLAALAFTWGIYVVAGGLVLTVGQSVALIGNLALTTFWPAGKVNLVRTFQRGLLNPLVRLLFAVGINPLGLAVLETHGRVSGRLRRTPVGNGRQGATFWIIAEHGPRAGYLRNIQHDPRVRVRLRIGLRYRWLDGLAEIQPDDDALARQRRIIRWHPLRALNAMNVRVLGTELVTVRVGLLLDPTSNEPAGGAYQRVAQRRQPAAV